jgi:hypothetical protein
MRKLLDEALGLGAVEHGVVRREEELETVPTARGCGWP